MEFRKLFLSPILPFAEDWVFSLRDKDRQGLIKNEKTFKQVADLFAHEYEAMTKGQRSPKWVEGHKARLRLHLVPSLVTRDDLRSRRD